MRLPPIRHNGRPSHGASGTLVAIRVDARFDASPERVFGAWLDPDVACRWLFATATQPIARVEIEPRVSGGFRFVERREKGDVEHRGAYVEIVPHRRLVFSLALVDERNTQTRVTVTIEPRANGCDLALTHDNVPVDLAYGVEARWTGMLYGLAVTLDSVEAASMTKHPKVATHGPNERPGFAEGRWL